MGVRMANYDDNDQDDNVDDGYDAPSGYYDMADKLDSRHIFGNF
jgi:hypothetical protein